MAAPDGLFRALMRAMVRRLGALVLFEIAKIAIGDKVRKLTRTYDGGYSKKLRLIGWTNVRFQIRQHSP